MIAAHELGIAEDLELTRSVAAMTGCNPDIMADNPLNKIPVLVLDDGTIIVDSRVISEYFASLVPAPSLVAPPGPERWWTLSNQAMSDGLLDLLILWRNEQNKPQERQTAAWLSAFDAKAAASLDRFEAVAGQFAARDFGLAHISLGCVLSYADFRFADLDWRAGRPALAAWHERFCARPSAKATEIEDG